MQPHHTNLWWAHIHTVLDFPREETGKGNKEQDWIQPRGEHIHHNSSSRGEKDEIGREATGV